MSTPTIIQAGRYQVAAVKMNGSTHIGVREADNMPWSLFGHVLAVGSLALAISTIGQKWVEIRTWPEGLAISSRVKGADSPSDKIRTDLPRDILVGVGSIPSFRVPSLDDANDLAKVFQDMFDGTIDVEALIPVDGDLSEHSKGVNYGRA